MEEILYSDLCEWKRSNLIQGYRVPCIKKTVHDIPKSKTCPYCERLICIEKDDENKLTGK